MTQRERVLQMLRNAGKDGLSSRELITSYMPRGAARVQELRDAGFNIISEREGKFVRYYLLVGVGEGEVVGVRAATSGGSADSDDAPEQLFETPTPRRRHDFIEGEWAA